MNNSLTFRYNALMTSYNNLYQEFKKLKKGQEPTLTRTRKKSSKKKKKTPSKTSLLFSNQNHVTLTRTVSAPLITEKNTLHRITDGMRMCQTPKASTLGAAPEDLPLTMDLGNYRLYRYSFSKVFRQISYCSHLYIVKCH